MDPLESAVAEQAFERTVSHYVDYIGRDCPVEYRIIIPSYDRPEALCSETLPYLKQCGIDMRSVAVFVSPETAPGQSEPEWSRYLDAFRQHGMLEVQLRPGGKGLTGNMFAALMWVPTTYFIVMSDRVREIREPHAGRAGETPRLVAAKPTVLKALIAHAWDIMTVYNMNAWSTSANHNPMMLRADTLSRRLGLLDGSLTGCKKPRFWQSLQVHEPHGLIYDVEWSVRLWAAGLRFFRYSGLCVMHPYRSKGGQASVYRDPADRRRVENDCLHRLAAEFPRLIKFQRKSQASLKVMQYKFTPTPEKPLLMAEPAARRGRPCYRKCLSPMSEAERQRRSRRKVKAGKTMKSSMQKSKRRSSRLGAA